MNNVAVRTPYVNHDLQPNDKRQYILYEKQIYI
jgi:hypothetical protein